MNIEKCRFHMIEQQIRPWNVFDPSVLNLMASIPRELFVAAEQKTLAFADLQLELAHGQKMFSPRQEARMLQALAIDNGNKVLEIGTGSGFTAALMASQAYSVLTVDLFDDFITNAQARHEQLKLSNIECEVIDATGDWQPPSNLDVIAVTAKLLSHYNRQATDQQVEQYLSWLNPNGRLFTIEGDQNCSHAYLYHKQAETVTRQQLFEIDTPALIQQKSNQTFIF